MIAKVKIEFEIDGECKDKSKIKDAIFSLFSGAGYIGSEEIDGTEDWGIEIGSMEVKIIR